MPRCHHSSLCFVDAVVDIFQHVSVLESRASALINRKMRSAAILGVLLCIVRHCECDITAALQSLKFLHSGTVRAADNVTQYLQCNGFSESGAQWTDWGPRLYAYNVSADGSISAPAMGIRSAVPIGGLGTGSIELRADGRFADWTIENQGTSLASDAVRNSKIPFKDEAFLAVFAQSQAVGSSPFAAALRTVEISTCDGAEPTLSTSTSAAAGCAVPGLESISYSGAFPFSRLSAGLPNASAWPIAGPVLYSYSPFQLYSSEGSGVPAIAFTLVLSAPPTPAAAEEASSASGVDAVAAAAPVNVSFLLSLPLGVAKDTDRPLGAGGSSSAFSASVAAPDPRGQIITVKPNTTVADCITACEANPECTWYSHSGSGVAPVPPVTMANNDCPGNDISNPRIPLATIDDCIGLCANVTGCNGLVFDAIPGEQQPQCNNANSSLFCCLLKTQCTSYSGKNGDTAWAAGQPGVPSDQCTLLRLSPAVEQYIVPPASASASSSARPATGATSGIGPGAADDGPYRGPRSGVKGFWSPLSSFGLIHARNNTYDGSEGGSWQDPASAVADFTLLAADAMDGGAGGGVTASVWTGNDLSQLWSSFAADGQLPGAATEVAAGHGAIAVSAVLQPGQTTSLTLVFSWHLPHRLYVGQDLGNQYATRYNNSQQVAVETAQRLDAIVQDGADWNAAATNNSLPDWYQDFLVNSLATQVKMGVWVAKDANLNPVPGGRYRQFEAFSNCDLDPVHVSSYHMIPYATFWPDLSANTILTGWAQEQQGDGMIREFLGDFSAPGSYLRWVSALETLCPHRRHARWRLSVLRSSPRLTPPPSF